MQRTGDHPLEVAAWRIFETEMERIRTTAKDAGRKVGMRNAVKKGRKPSCQRKGERMGSKRKSLSASLFKTEEVYVLMS